MYDDDLVYGKDNKNDKQDMNVVINTDIHGSKITVKISNERKDITIKKEDKKRIMLGKENKLYHHDHQLEKQNLLKEVRDLLVSQKRENSKRVKEFYNEDKRTDLSDVMENLNLIAQRYKSIKNSGDERSDTELFGILKTQGRVLPIIMGEANATITQDYLSSHNSTNDILLQEDPKKPSEQFTLPVNSEGRKKMIRIFQRPRDEDQKNLTLQLKSSGLPVLQNLKNDTIVPRQLPDDDDDDDNVTKP